MLKPIQTYHQLNKIRMNSPVAALVKMLLFSHFIILSILFSIVLSKSVNGDFTQDKTTNHDEQMLLKASSSKDSNKFSDQQISVVGNLGCSKADADTVKAKIVLKISRNGKQIQHYFKKMLII